MKTYLIAAIIVATSIVTTHAETFAVDARIIGYDLKQGLPTSRNETKFPTINVQTGRPAQIEISQEYRYPINVDRDGEYKDFQTAYVGVQIPFQVYIKNGQINYIGRADLCDVAKNSAWIPSILKTSTPFRGEIIPGQPATVEVPTPQGGKAKLELTIRKL